MIAQCIAMYIISRNLSTETAYAIGRTVELQSEVESLKQKIEKLDLESQ